MDIADKRPAGEKWFVETTGSPCSSEIPVNCQEIQLSEIENSRENFKHCYEERQQHVRSGKDGIQEMERINIDILGIKEAR